MAQEEKEARPLPLPLPLLLLLLLPLVVPTHLMRMFAAQPPADRGVERRVG